MACWPCKTEIDNGSLCKGCQMDPDEQDEKVKKLRRKRKKK